MTEKLKQRWEDLKIQFKNAPTAAVIAMTILLLPFLIFWLVFGWGFFPSLIINVLLGMLMVQNKDKSESDSQEEKI